ncbi:armadillo-type protein [Radiomyces spectabilis]|uniref:armadillo-type protein n=1 Tax=Radiomyces spectabilis TaxID=64574 RepID=UPI00221F3349|nr:armadillo-type protein [Radiomyces spectabilis]KAI8384226.1 armadillo-type protein [Radiomyces spectabilis]
MDIAVLLTNSLSPDRNLREDATQKLELLAQENYANYALLLCQQLANEQAGDEIRMSAGLALKNSLTAKEYARKAEQMQRWLALDANVRGQIKQGVLISLATPRKPVGNIASQVVAAIAEIELPAGQWPDLINVMLEKISATDNPNLQQSTLQALGYVCEVTEPEVLTGQSHQILMSVIQGAQPKNTPEVRLAAIKALYNSLEFVKDNFEREGERNYIMQMVCEATQSDNTETQAAAFECLARIMQLYYDKMRYYMEKALYGITVAGMNHPEQNVALQAIEFWSTVCDEEMELKRELEEASLTGEPAEHAYHQFAEAALPEILPVLLWLLTKQEEDEDEDEWNTSMAAATCLSLLAQCVGNIIIPPIVPFVETNIQNNDWRYREAAVMAFGSILDGPEPHVVTPLVDQALPTLINMMKDPIVNVKDTVAWTLGRVSELLIHCIKPDVHLHDMVSALVLGLQDNPRIVGNCCWTLMNLAEQWGSTLGSETVSCPLSIYYEGIITALMQFTERSDNEANSRTSAYEAIATLMMFAADDCLPIVQNVVIMMLDRLEASVTMENQIVGTDERMDHAELQSSLLGVLTNCIRRVSREIAGVSDRIMTVILQLLNSGNKQSTITEDAFLAVGALTASLEADFNRYVEPFMPILYQALQNPAEYQLCLIAVGIIGDICRALGKGATVYCNNVMQLLVANLQSPVLHRTVKPSILSCFGDIALAIGDDFEPYLEVVMLVLQQAGSMRADTDNYDMIDYVNTLHEGNVEAYVGIVQGFNGSAKISLLLQYIPYIFSFLKSIAIDPHRSDSLTRAVVGLLGDLAEAFGSQIKQFLQEEWIPVFLREVRVSRHFGTSTKETSRWAKEMIKRACQ